MKLGATLVLTALAWLWLVYTQIPDAGAEWPGPRGFPLLLGIVLAILGVIVAVQPGSRGRPGPKEKPGPKGPGLRGSGPGLRASDSTPADVGRVLSDPPREGRTALLTFVMLVVYAFFLDRAGFLVSTAALMVAAMAVVLRIRRWLFIGAFSAAFSLGSWAIFSLLLGIPLPRGTWLPW